MESTGEHLTDTATNPDPGPGAVVELDGWRSFLGAEEDRCRRQGFGAAVISIDFGGGDPDALAARAERVRSVVVGELASTDRLARLSPTEMAVVVIPVEGPAQAGRRADALSAALRSAGIDAAIGWAIRRDHDGLLGAAARADAAAATVARTRGRTLDLR